MTNYFDEKTMMTKPCSCWSCCDVPWRHVTSRGAPGSGEYVCLLPPFEELKRIAQEIGDYTTDEELQELIDGAADFYTVLVPAGDVSTVGGVYARPRSIMGAEWCSVDATT